MTAPAPLLAQTVMCKQFSDANTSAFAQAVAANYLAAGHLGQALENARRVYARRARVMGQALREQLGEAIAFTPPQGGLFIWARLTGAGGALADGAALAPKAIAQGVAFVPGAPFFATQPEAATLRLSFATAGEDDIREGVARLARALRV